jgi:hypothetical protein
MMVKQQDWKKLLKADTTDWLLEPDDPGVRYLALRDIVEADEKEIKATRCKAHREGPIAQILADMNPEGYWVKPGPGYSPKCRGTVFSIISLAQLGASIEEDKCIGTAYAYLMNHTMAPGGQFAINGKATHSFDCLQGNMLTSMLDMGVKDSRLDIAFDWMARTVTGEGLTSGERGSLTFRNMYYVKGPLFACRHNDNVPCAWAGVKVMTAFSRLPVEGRSDLIERAIDAGVEFFFSVDPSTAGYPTRDGREPNSIWWKFSFLFGTDILQLAEALTGLGYSGDPRLANTLDLIKGRQDDNGRWPLDLDFSKRMWLSYGSVNKPNKWVTLRALRVLKQAEQQKSK